MSSLYFTVADLHLILLCQKQAFSGHSAFDAIITKAIGLLWLFDAYLTVTGGFSGHLKPFQLKRNYLYDQPSVV